MRKIKLNVLIVVLAIAGGAMWKSRPSQKESPMTAAREQNVKAVDREPTSIPAVKAKAKDQASVVSTPHAPIQVAPLGFAKELASYSTLKQKVFLNPSEQGEKAGMLKNPALLRAMGVRLMRSAVDARAATEQNLAVDLLLEALHDGDSEVASEVLRSVVTDGQVEDEKLDMASRENLAGIKAEVLFQWSALKPEQTQEMASLLPGPVSHKIWQNVVNAQASNIAESADIDP